MNLISKIIERLKSLTEVSESETSDKFYHESGHVVIIKLFDETFILEFVTLDLTTSKQNDPGSFGAVKANYAKGVAALTALDYDKLVLAALAGYCVDELVMNSWNIPPLSFDYYNWQERFDAPRYRGDLQLVNTAYDEIRLKLQLSWREYISSCLQCLYNILNDLSVQRAVGSVRDRLQHAGNHTLSRDEVDSILIKVGFDTWKQLNKPKIVKERMELFFPMKD